MTTVPIPDQPPTPLAAPVDCDGVVVAGRDLALGAVLLRLICDWDSWIERRVDSFSFAGDDERVLERHQSVDLVVPHELIALQRSLGEDPSAIPVPITFVNKWRLPQFSLRDEQGRAVALLARQESTPLGAAMLLALGDFVLSGGLRPTTASGMSGTLERTIVKIAASEPVESLALCASLADVDDSESKKLAGSEVFMSLAYELARGFPLIALLPVSAQRRRVIKFRYASYVVPARRDPRLVQLRHLARLLRNRSWDLTETSGWRKRIDPPKLGQAELVFSVQGEYVTERFREREREGGIACVLATVKGEGRRSRTIRLQPNAAVRLHGLPPGRYTVKLRGVSGFRVKGPQRDEVDLGPGPSGYDVATERDDVTKRVTQAAPRIAGRPWIGLRLSRALSLNNKPLAIRVRVGHGGSYHCEFEAPPGLHVTRARLISDVGAENPTVHDGTSRSGEIDVVLESKQRAHLYAPAEKAVPAAAYAYLHLRPRVETIGRSALLTAIISTIVLGFIALSWDPSIGYIGHGPYDRVRVMAARRLPEMHYAVGPRAPDFLDVLVEETPLNQRRVARDQPAPPSQQPQPASWAVQAPVSR